MIHSVEDSNTIVASGLHCTPDDVSHCHLHTHMGNTAATAGGGGKAHVKVKGFTVTPPGVDLSKPSYYNAGGPLAPTKTQDPAGVYDIAATLPNTPLSPSAWNYGGN